MSFLTAIGGFCILLVALASSADIVYIFFCIAITTIYSITVILNGLNKVAWAKFYATAIVPLWFYSGIVVGGGKFSESICIAAAMALTYVLYRKDDRTKYMILGYQVSFYVLSVSYIAFYPPLFGVVNFPLDEAAIFLLSLGWIYILIQFHETEKDILIRELKDKNQELEIKTEELGRFTYIASHDLKTPLRTIISFAGLMEKSIQEKKYKDLDEQVAFVKSGAKQMHYLIQDILELSRVDYGKKVDFKWLNLNSILKKVEANLKLEIEEKNAKIFTEELPLFNCNESEFLLLFQNMIQNGIKYNINKTPIVQIWSECTEDTLRINFKDNGIGIEKEYYEKIFQFFQRLHTSEKYEGTGLGLGLCLKIVKKYRGQILIDSKVNIGTTFTLEFPYHLTPDVQDLYEKNGKTLLSDISAQS